MSRPAAGIAPNHPVSRSATAGKATTRAAAGTSGRLR
jgi:hypothetical protein